MPLTSVNQTHIMKSRNTIDHIQINIFNIFCKFQTLCNYHTDMVSPVRLIKIIIPWYYMTFNILNQFCIDTP